MTKIFKLTCDTDGVVEVAETYHSTLSGALEHADSWAMEVLDLPGEDFSKLTGWGDDKDVTGRTYRDLDAVYQVIDEITLMD